MEKPELTDEQKAWESKAKGIIKAKGWDAKKIAIDHSKITTEDQYRALYRASKGSISDGGWCVFVTNGEVGKEAEGTIYEADAEIMKAIFDVRPPAED